MIKLISENLVHFGNENLQSFPSEIFINLFIIVLNNHIWVFNLWNSDSWIENAIFLFLIILDISFLCWRFFKPLIFPKIRWSFSLNRLFSYILIWKNLLQLGFLWILILVNECLNQFFKELIGYEVSLFNKGRRNLWELFFLSFNKYSKAFTQILRCGIWLEPKCL